MKSVVIGAKKSFQVVALAIPIVLLTQSTWALEEIETVDVVGRWLDKNGEQAVFDFPGARDVVRREDFLAQGATTLAEALRMIPGVQAPEHTDNSESSFNLSVRGLQGRYTSRTTVLLDGVPLSVAPYGQPHLSLAPTTLGNLGAIDVVKSGGAVRYGPQNVGGILNFSTVEIPQEFSTTVNWRESFYGADSNGDDRSNVSLLSGTTLDNGLGLALLYSGQHGGGYREHGNTDIDDIILKYSYDLTSHIKASGRLHYYEADNELPGGLTQAEYDRDAYQSTRPHDRFQGKRKEAVLRLDADLAADKTFELSTYYTESFREFTLANVPEGYSGRLDRLPRNYNVFALEPRYSQLFEVGNSLQEVSVGYRYLDEKGREQRFRKSNIPAFGNPDDFMAHINRDNSNTTRAHSLYVDDKIEVGGWTVTPGVRFERVTMERTNNLSGFEEVLKFSESLPSVNALYAYSSQVNLFASYNESFTTMTYAQLNRRDELDNISPERSRIYELGARFHGEAMNLEATLFMIRFDDIIQYDGTLEQHVNRGETLHRGIELAGSWVLGEVWRGFSGWSVRANYTYTNATFEEGDVDGNDLSFYSNHVGSLGLNYQRDRWAFNLTTYAQSEQYVDDANTEDDPYDPDHVRSGGLGRIPGYGYTSLRVNYALPEVGKGSSVSLGIKNLFDKAYYSRSNFSERGLYAGAPRAVYVETSLKF